MDAKLFAMIFGAVFVAELGDKTQLATLLFASDATNPKWTVFFAAALALVLAAAVGVIVGTLASDYLNQKLLNWVAGLGFIAIGIWTLAQA